MTKFSPAPKALQAYYGSQVSGVLRSDRFPNGPTCFVVQRQSASCEHASRWTSLAVYRTEEAAAATIERWEGSHETAGVLNLETDEVTPLPEQPVAMYRIVTLLDLFQEGPDALFAVFLSLATSDHEWFISTEIGSKNKLALLFGQAADGDDSG